MRRNWPKPASLGLLYEFPERMLKDNNFRDPANFYITNPNLGRSVDEEFLRDELGKAERAGPQSLRGFAAKHLNVQIGIALSSEGWAGADVWVQGIEPGLTFSTVLARSST